MTTNIRLPFDLWKTLKLEAAERGKRFSEIVRERLSASPLKARSKKGKLKIQKSLYGIWAGAEIPDSAFKEAKASLFPPPEKFIRQS